MLKYNVKVLVIISFVEWSGVNFLRLVSVFRGKFEVSREMIIVGICIKNLMVLVVFYRICV